MKHVAVVCRKETDISSGTEGAWTSFIGDDQEDVITRALKHRDITAGKYQSFSYVVLVGELNLEAVPRAEYSLRSIKGGSK